MSHPNGHDTIVPRPGAHYATGANLSSSRRTSADGEVWAFVDYEQARRSLVANITLDGRDEDGVDVAAIAAELESAPTGTDWHERDPYGWGLVWHNRPASECSECMIVTLDQYGAPTFHPFDDDDNED